MTQWGSMLNYTEPGFSNRIRWKQETLKRVTIPPPPIFLSPHTNINMPHGVLSCIVSCYYFCSLVTSDNSSTPSWKEYFVVENTNLIDLKVSSASYPLLPVRIIWGALSACCLDCPHSCSLCILHGRPRLQAVPTQPFLLLTATLQGPSGGELKKSGHF